MEENHNRMIMNYIYIMIAWYGHKEEKYRFKEKNRISLRSFKQKYLNYLNIIYASDWCVFDINVSSAPETPTGFLESVFEPQVRNVSHCGSFEFYLGKNPGTSMVILFYQYEKLNHLLNSSFYLFICPSPPTTLSASHQHKYTYTKDW